MARAKATAYGLIKTPQTQTREWAGGIVPVRVPGRVVPVPIKPTGVTTIVGVTGQKPAKCKKWPKNYFLKGECAPP